MPKNAKIHSYKFSTNDDDAEKIVCYEFFSY